MIHRSAFGALLLIGGASDALSQSGGAQPLSRAAFIATMDSEYRSIDRNRDQSLSRSELEAHQRGVQAASAARRARAAFASIDADRNGQISVDEFIKANAQPAVVDGGAIMSRLDTDRDQKVTVVEYRILTLANFDRIDTDRDGVLTAAEQRASGIRR